MIEVRITGAEMAECKSAFDYGQYVISRLKEAGIPAGYDLKSDSLVVSAGTVDMGCFDPVSNCHVLRWWSKEEINGAARQMVDCAMMQSDPCGLVRQ